MAVKSPVAEVVCAQASPSSSEVDCLGSDVNWDNVRPAPDSNKFSHLAAEEMEVIFVEGNL